MTERRAPSLRRNFGHAFIGNTVYAGSQWLLVVIIAKFGNPEQLGQYSIGMAYAVPVFQLASLNLRALQATDQQRELDFGSYASARILTSLFAVVTTLLLARLSGLRGEALVVVAAVAGTKVADSIHDVIYGQLQKVEDLGGIAQSMGVRGLLSISFAGVVLVQSQSVAIALLAVAVLSIPVVAAIDWRRLPFDARSALRWQPFGISRVVTMGLPLGVIGVLDSLNVNIPKYVLQVTADVEAVGSLSAILALIMLGGVVLSALGNTALPRLAVMWTSGNVDGFHQITRRLVLLAATIGGVGVIFAVFFGEWLLTTVYSLEVAAEAAAFSIVMLGAALWYVVTVLGFALNATRQFKQQLSVFIAMDATTLMFSLALVPGLGARGASIAFTAGVAVRLILSARMYDRALVCARNLRAND